MSTLATTTVTARAPVDLGNGTSVLITPWPEVVQLEFYENAKAASEEYLKKANLSYDEYENLRQQNPQANLPELKKPQESDKNPNSGAARISPPAAVSLTPNVRQARVYTMPLLQPPEPPPYQPQGVVENAEHVGGMVVGAAKAVGSGLLAAASYVSDSIWQLGDLLTAGYFRDSGLVQGVLQRQNNRGGAIVNAAQHPIDTATAVLNDLRARQQQAEALRAAGDFYEAGKISGTILVDVYPGSGAAAGMVKKLPHGEHLPAPKHGSDGVVILKNRAQRLEELAKDPAHGGQISPKTLREAEVGLALEENGKLQGPISRDPTVNGGAEFIDATGQKWDVKGPWSETPTGRGAFDLEKISINLEKEFSRGCNVIIDTAKMSSQHIDDLKRVIESSGNNGRVIWY